MIFLYETLQLKCELKFSQTITYQGITTSTSLQLKTNCVSGTKQCMDLQFDSESMREYREALEQMLPGSSGGITEFSGGMCPYAETVQQCEEIFNTTCKDVSGQYMTGTMSMQTSNSYDPSGNLDYDDLPISYPVGAIPTGTFEGGTNGVGELSTGGIVGIVIAVIVVIAVIAIVAYCCYRKKKQQQPQTQMRGENVA